MTARPLNPLAFVLITVAGCSGQPFPTVAPASSGPKSAVYHTDPSTKHLPKCVMTKRGCLDLETEYIPGVVECELGRLTRSGPALEAQAIAARTFLARHLKGRRADTVVPVSPRFQCWRPPVRLHSRDAAKFTRGTVLLWRGDLTTGNYVAGTRKLTVKCTPKSPEASGYTFSDWAQMRDAFKDKKPGVSFGGTDWTEIFVTHNEGREADEVRPTTLARPVAYNRGALSQNGAICLAENLGYETLDILQYFYGNDVRLNRDIK
ncbi:MAG: SpoIID/LytB domain-containing protein [Myxococcota bacterium]|nr:SpoIID/LytB domain-containing protein [Myxococcota bacterium]